ncbi:hypothetical protein JF770_06405 [Mycobacterium intracellulare]|uniref:hypothetical protein n=1 Tax=Mycobacterium intracellulare TaxID=1767 RepID=UPI001CD9D853|nr:hypothetical protein [Mycobacterium intracellulare]MCA2303186.1 hypothetical protein [Mycobacterium intracellulare]MCA2346461.1 hypothetical protein [Mycobacterium intracellulare]
MTYKITGETALVLVRGQDGEVRYHSECGPVIPWMAPSQAERYLELGVVERIDDTAT